MTTWSRLICTSSLLRNMSFNLWICHKLHRWLGNPWNLHVWIMSCKTWKQKKYMNSSERYSKANYKRQKESDWEHLFFMYINGEKIKPTNVEVTAADLTVSSLLKHREGWKRGGTRGKTERGMICRRWAKESHTSIHLCQGRREERGRRKDEMEECGEQRESELTERLTTCSIFGVILGAYICKCVQQMWGWEGKLGILVWRAYSSCVSKNVALFICTSGSPYL